jgi:hypothetical protein
MTPEEIEATLRATTPTLVTQIGSVVTEHAAGSPEYEAWIADGVRSALRQQERQAEREAYLGEGERARQAVAVLAADLALWETPEPLTALQQRQTVIHILRALIALIRFTIRSSA